MDGTRSALLVASYDYQDPELRRLRAPARDAEALAEVLGDPAIGGFEVHTLLNEPAHVINETVEGFFADRRPDDLLLVHFSCHGIKDDGGELHFAAANTKLGRLGATAVAAQFVNRQMNRSRSRRVVLLLDCCYAGAFERGMTARAGNEVGIQEQLGGRGRAVITASSAMEYAFEGDTLADDRELQPSVFTSALVDGLTTGDADRDEDGWVALDELYDYVYDQVRGTTSSQTPGKWMFGVQGELVIARRARPVTTPAPLPVEVQQAIHHPLAGVRAGVVDELRYLLQVGHAGLALAARQALEHLTEDDSRRVSAVAKAALAASVQPTATHLEAVFRPPRRAEIGGRESPGGVLGTPLPASQGPPLPTASSEPASPAEGRPDRPATHPTSHQADVGAVIDLNPRLEPVESHGHLRGRHRLLLRNEETDPVRVELSASDPSAALRYVLPTRPVIIPAEGSAEVVLHLLCRHLSLLGQPRRHQFTLTYQQPGLTGAARVDGVFVQHPILPRPVLVLALLIVALLAFLNLLSPDDGDDAIPPPSPQVNKINSIGTNKVQLIWARNPNAVGYRVEKVLPAERGEGVEDSKEVPGERSAYTWEALPADTEHCFRVVALNDAGASEPSERSCVKTPKAGGATAAPPKGLTVVAKGEQALLSWLSVDNRASYVVFMDGTKAADVPAGKASAAIPVTTPEGHCFRVQTVIGDALSEPSAEVCVPIR